jgi:hypothetical protein
MRSGVAAAGAFLLPAFLAAVGFFGAGFSAASPAREAGDSVKIEIKTAVLIESAMRDKRCAVRVAGEGILPGAHTKKVLGAMTCAPRRRYILDELSTPTYRPHFAA